MSRKLIICFLSLILIFSFSIVAFASTLVMPTTDNRTLELTGYNNLVHYNIPLSITSSNKYVLISCPNFYATGNTWQISHNGVFVNINNGDSGYLLFYYSDSFSPKNDGSSNFFSVDNQTISGSVGCILRASASSQSSYQVLWSFSGQDWYPIDGYQYDFSFYSTHNMSIYGGAGSKVIASTLQTLYNQNGNTYKGLDDSGYVGGVNSSMESAKSALASTTFHVPYNANRTIETDMSYLTTAVSNICSPYSVTSTINFNGSINRFEATLSNGNQTETVVLNVNYVTSGGVTDSSSLHMPVRSDYGSDIFGTISYGLDMVLYYIQLPFYMLGNLLSSLICGLGDLLNQFGGVGDFFKQIFSFLPAPVTGAISTLCLLYIVFFIVKMIRG